MGLTLVLTLVVGIVLGLLGGGGSMLVVPLLLYVLGLPPERAIALSLWIVGSGAGAAVIPHARAGHVHLRPVVVVGGAGMLGALLGGRLSLGLPASLLLGTLAVVMFAAGLAMMRGRKAGSAGACDGPRCYVRLFGVGFGVGFFAGLVGAGGGFLIVPALVLFAGLELRDAVGTSLAVLALQSFAGFVAHIGAMDVPFATAAATAGAMAIGSLLGASGARSVPTEKLRMAFGVLTITLSAVLLGDALFHVRSPALVAVGLVLAFVASRLVRPAKASTPGASAPPSVPGVALRRPSTPPAA